MTIHDGLTTSFNSMDQLETYQSFLKRILNQYYPVRDTSISALMQIARIHDLQKGQTLLPIGNVSRQIHVLYSGVVVSYYINNDGTLYHKNIFLAGNFVGSMVSAIAQQPSEFALEVIENATLISFDYIRYRQLINQHTDLKDFYIAYLEKNWVVDKERRELDIVLKNAQERYLDFMTMHPQIEERIPLHYIASHLGITPTQLSRIRKKLKKKDPPQPM